MILSCIVVAIVIFAIAIFRLTKSSELAKFINRPFSRVISVALTIAGFFLMVNESANIEHGFARKEWPVVQGFVVKSEVVGDRVFEPRVTYEYNVDDQVFTTQTDTRIPRFGGRSSINDVAFKIVAMYREGDSVPVFYDPENPGNSYLKPGPLWDQFTRLSLGTMLFGSGIFGICGILTSVAANRLP